VQQRTADLTAVVEENLAGAHVVRGMAAERQQIAALERAAERQRWAAEEEIRLRARYQPLLEALPRLAIALFVLYGGYLAVHGEVTVGTLVLFTVYVAFLQHPFRVLGFIVMMGQRARASAGRIFEVVDAQPEIVTPPGAPDLIDPLGLVTFEHVRFGYGDGPDVLHDVSLELRPGETVALVGRTGCGKSTLARLVPRFYDVRDGRVTVDGHDVRELTLESLRTHVGIVLEEPFLFTSSIRDNIAFGRPDALLDDVQEAARAAGATAFIEELPDGFDTVVGERGYTLSGGQRQRISIARMLLHNPKVLVLDDATSAIDVQVEQQIHDALERLLEGRTTLVIAHRLSTIAVADRVAFLKDGVIAATGTHRELLDTVPEYADVLLHIEDRAAAAMQQDKQAPAPPSWSDADADLPRSLDDLR
ncbi:MAG TPA: ABC transporter ATP-binding protein, partial [Nitriliruptorales bacterium]